MYIGFSFPYTFLLRPNNLHYIDNIVMRFFLVEISPHIICNYRRFKKFRHRHIGGSAVTHSIIEIKSIYQDKRAIFDSNSQHCDFFLNGLGFVNRLACFLVISNYYLYIFRSLIIWINNGNAILGKNHFIIIGDYPVFIL